MTGDVVARAKAALVGVTDGPWRWEATPPEADNHDYIWGPGRAQMLCAMDLIGGETADGEFFAAARDLVPELVAEVERLRGELPVELDEDSGWIDRDGNFWSYDDINTWQWWIRPPGCDSGAATPLAKHGPFVKGRWDYDQNGPVAL